MALTDLEAEVWSQKFNQALRAELVAMELVDDDLIMATAAVGKTVHISRLSDPVVADYNPSGNAFPDLTTSGVDVVMSEDKWCAFQIENSAEFFSPTSINSEAMINAAAAVAEDMDIFIFGDIPALCGIVMDDGADGYLVINSSNIQAFLDDLLVNFNTANIPKSSRRFIIPAFMDPLIRRLEIANNANEGMGVSFISNVYGINFFMSNNINSPSAGQYDAVGGSKGAYQFAVRYTRLWAGGLEAAGKDASAAFTHVFYGGNAVKPEALILAKVASA